MTPIPLSFFDWAIMFVYFAFIAWIGFYLKKFTKTDDDFLPEEETVCGFAASHLCRQTWVRWK
jgi:Na+/proline symporter